MKTLLMLFTLLLISACTSTPDKTPQQDEDYIQALLKNRDLQRMANLDLHLYVNFISSIKEKSSIPMNFDRAIFNFKQEDFPKINLKEVAEADMKDGNFIFIDKIPEHALRYNEDKFAEALKEKYKLHVIQFRISMYAHNFLNYINSYNKAVVQKLTELHGKNIIKEEEDFWIEQYKKSIKSRNKP